MKWKRGAGRGDVEDMRGRGGGLGGAGIPIGGIGGGAGLILLLLVVLLNGGLPGGGSSGGPLDPLPTVASPQAQPGEPQTSDNQTEFVYFVTADVQNTWEDIFKRAGETYPRTTLRLFSDQVSTGCGVGSSATGPFYCPPDQHVYLDMTFFQELKNRFGAAGDFAQAYVIAHEFGHHVQHSLGIDEQVKSREDGIKLELQADCLAGVWGHSAAAAEAARARRPRGGPRRSGVGRRRPDPAEDPGPRRPRVVDARLRRPAAEVVQGRLRQRRPDRLRHLQDVAEPP